MDIINANSICIDDLLTRFLRYIDVSELTAKSYRKGIQLFISYLNGRTPTREEVLGYKEYLINSCKPTTVNARLTAIKQFFKWLSYEKIYPNIAENIKQVKIGEIQKNYPILEEIHMIIKSINNNYDKALFMLLIGTGVRLKEAMCANIEDIKELHGEKVLYVQGKGRVGKEEYVKLSDGVFKALNELIMERKHGAIFLSTSNQNRGERASTRALYNRVKKIYKNAGIDEKKFTCHALRGSFSVIAMENGASIYEISKVLRHKSINTTECYLRSLDRTRNKTEYIVGKVLEI